MSGLALAAGYMSRGGLRARETARREEREDSAEERTAEKHEEWQSGAGLRKRRAEADTSSAETLSEARGAEFEEWKGDAGLRARKGEASTSQAETAAALSGSKFDEWERTAELRDRERAAKVSSAEWQEQQNQYRTRALQRDDEVGGLMHEWEMKRAEVEAGQGAEVNDKLYERKLAEIERAEHEDQYRLYLSLGEDAFVDAINNFKGNGIDNAAGVRRVKDPGTGRSLLQLIDESGQIVRDPEGNRPQVWDEESLHQLFGANQDSLVYDASGHTHIFDPLTNTTTPLTTADGKPIVNSKANRGNGNKPTVDIPGIGPGIPVDDAHDIYQGEVRRTNMGEPVETFGEWLRGKGGGPGTGGPQAPPGARTTGPDGEAPPVEGAVYNTKDQQWYVKHQGGWGRVTAKGEGAQRTGRRSAGEKAQKRPDGFSADAPSTAAARGHKAKVLKRLQGELDAISDETELADWLSEMMRTTPEYAQRDVQKLVRDRRVAMKADQ